MAGFTFATNKIPVPVNSISAAGAQAPIKNANGLITGYSSSANPALAAAPGSVPPTMLPVLNSKGQTVGYSSGTGHDHLPASGNAAPPSDDPNSTFSLLHQTKSQPIADATTGLLASTKAGQDQMTKSFSDYLKEAQDQNAKNAAQIEQDRSVLNDTSGYAKQLADINAQYSAAAHGTNQQIIDSNDQYQATQQKTVQQLAEENARYEAAAQAAAGQAVAYAQGQNKLYQSASGTPTSDSGDMRARALQAYLGVNVPLQADLSNRRLAQIQNVIMPLNREYNTNHLQQLQGFQAPMDQNIASMGTASANTVESLKASLAGRSLNESIAYMQSIGIPFGIMQQVLSSNINNVAGISAIDQGNNFYGLSQPYAQPQLSLPSYTGSGNPGGFPRQQPQNGPVNYGPQTTPKTVGPPQQNLNGVGFDPMTREYYRQQTGYYPETDPNFSPEAYQRLYQNLHQSKTYPAYGGPNGDTYSPPETPTISPAYSPGGPYIDAPYVNSPYQNA